MFDAPKTNHESKNFLFNLSSHNCICLKAVSAKDVALVESHGLTACTLPFTTGSYHCALRVSIKERYFSLLDWIFTIAASKALYLIMFAYVLSLSALLKKRDIISSNRTRASAKVTDSSCSALVTVSTSWSLLNSALRASFSTSARSGCDISGKLVHQKPCPCFCYLQQSLLCFIGLPMYLKYVLYINVVFLSIKCSFVFSCQKAKKTVFVPNCSVCKKRGRYSNVVGVSNATSVKTIVNLSRRVSWIFFSTSRMTLCM